MGKSRRYWLAGAAGMFLVVLLFACTREYDSPYVPGSGSYAGDDWTRDADGNGMADSVEKYAPECPKTPKECIENAKVLSRIGQGYSLTAVDMILWHGSAPVQPRLTWDPVEANVRGFTLSSSDTAKVKIKDGLLDPVGVGNAQVSVTVPGESRAASFIVKVVPRAGAQVKSLTAKDMVLEAGKEAPPEITWTPADADYKEYRLSIDEPSVGWPVGESIKAIFAGTAKVTVEALDGGHKTAFTLTVTETPPRVEAVSVAVEDMFMLAGGEAESPVVVWNPGNVTDKRFLLAPTDTAVAGVNKERDRIVPRSKGSTQVILYALDGSSKTADFSVNVTDSAVAVTGILAADLKLTVGSFPTAARITWTPADATNRKYTLSSLIPDVARVEGNLIVPASLGRSTMTATAADGGFEAIFVVDVVQQDTAVHVDSVRALDMSLSVGVEKQPTLTWFPENAGIQEYSLSTSDEAVATVSGHLVKATGTGTATVTLTTADGARTTAFKVDVMSPIIPVQSVRGEPMSMVVGQISSPDLTWSPGTATNLTYTLVSDNGNIARIVNQTSVEAVAVGTANIIIRSTDGPSDTVQVTVNAKAIPVTSIAMAGLTMAVGDPDKDVSSLILWTPANATNKTFKLLSTSNSAATSIVDNKLKAVASGSANVVIESQDLDRMKDTFTVTVKVPVKSVVVRDTSVWPATADIDPEVLIAWNPANADNKTYALTSLDTTVASVVSGTRIRPKGSGYANVILRSLENSTKLDTFRVTVKVPVKSISVRDTTVKVGALGVNVWGNIVWNPAEATEKTFWIAWVGAPNAAILTMPNTYTFNAVGPGVASIAVGSGQNGWAKDTIKVTVLQPLAGITAANASMKVGDPDYSPAITYSPSNASEKGYSLSGGAFGIASAVGGKVHAEGPGVATFKVTSNDGGRIANFTATVTLPVTALSAANMTLDPGDADRDPVLTWTPANPSSKVYSMVSSNLAAVTIVANKVHAVAAGVSTVTVTSADGPKCTFEVAVTQSVLGITAADMTMSKGDPDKDPVLTWNPANPSSKGYALSGGNAAIATPAGGKVRAVGGGSTSMIVTTTDGGKTDTFTVNVIVPLISFQAADFEMRDFDPDQLPHLTWVPADATTKTYTMVSSQTSNVSVVGNKLHAVSRGTSEITITTTDGGYVQKFIVQVR